MSNFYHPKYKYVYVNWFVKQGILTKSKANKMTKKQLQGKYYEIRKGEFYG